jgi:hypothetical protein
MTSPKNNPNDTFWLARYAHNTLTPIIEALPGQDDKVFAYLYLSITAHPDFPGLDIWIHQKGLTTNGVVDYGTISVTKDTVDAIAERLPRMWQRALSPAVSA